MIVFQLTLIVSGNLSFLNWLTIVPLLAASRRRALSRAACAACVARGARAALPPAPRAARVALAAVVALLSIAPDREHALAPPAHERRLRSAHAGQHLRRVRQRGTRAPRADHRGHARPSPGPSARWLAVRAAVQARRPSRALPIVSAAPAAPRLADVVRGHVQRRGRAVDAARGVEAAARRSTAAPLLAHDPFGDDAAALRPHHALPLPVRAAWISAHLDARSWRATGCRRCPPTTSCATPSDSSAMRSRQRTFVALKAVP